MTQRELNRAVAEATGESMSTVSSLGFVPLTVGPVEREPPAIDWDELADELCGPLSPPQLRRAA
jgi:hypothetical protein